MTYGFVISILVLAICLFVGEKLFESKGQTDYVIGILSGRDHFEQREIIRQTWLSYVEDRNDMKYYFIVGEKSCDLPSTIKSNLYDCDEVKFEDSLSRTNFLVNKLIKSNSSNHLYKSFIFQLHSDLTIRKLGVLKFLIEKLDFVQFALKDYSNDVLYSRELFQVTNETIESERYIYFDLKQPIELKRNFVGELSVENFDEADWAGEKFKQFETIRNDKFNLLRILKVKDDSQTLKRSRSQLILTSFDYFITNSTDLKIRLKNLDTEKRIMQQNLDQIQTKLKIESTLYNDIKFIDVIDTYRNLPDKLLKFLDYISIKYKFKYFIKADDDSFLNLKHIRQQIESVSSWSDKVWFGNFRKNWKINEIGKWAELNYESFTYPPFPCGAAYILSSYLVNWLSKNAEFLFRFQGEDVSTGIWLASILPEYENDERWICDKDHYFQNYPRKNDYFCVGQLTTEEQVRLFKAINLN